jgi:integrase
MRARLTALDKIAQGLDPLADDTNYSVKQACDAYLAECGEKPSHWRMKYYADALVSKLGHRPLAQVGEIDLRKLRRDLEGTGLSPQTVNKYFSWLRAASNFARGTGRVRITFWDACDQKTRARVFAKEPTIKVDVPETSDLDAVLAHLPTRYHAPTRLALLTGMRRGEVFGLRWSEVEFDKQSGSWWITLPDATEDPGRRTKSGKGRTIPLTSDAFALLPTRSATAKDHDPVWGTDLLVSFPCAWQRARTKAGLPTLRFHDLRHAFASNFLNKTGDVVALREIAGWASVSMADRYTHAKRDRQMNAMKIASQEGA